MSVTGKDLIEMGYKPAPLFKHVIETATDIEDARRMAEHELSLIPETLPLQDAISYSRYIEATNDDEAANLDAVIRTMDLLVRTPTVRQAAIMPDACPAGPDGTIPVGGVVAAENAIHPGMHSADICCSVMLTEFDGVDPARLMDVMHVVTHFGPGGRILEFPVKMTDDLLIRICGNRFLNDERTIDLARDHFATQGDGNHFTYVGTMKSTGRTTLVTHHGSRGFGAALYKKGMALAEKYRKKLSPDTLKQNAWIPADSEDGREYWEALQIVREWTKQSHAALHMECGFWTGATAVRNFWNEHNFVFRDGDMFWHGKGATPTRADFLPDTTGLQIVPLNMAQPVLIIEQGANDLGFAPHGAGRNMSRTAHKRGLCETDEHVFARETAGIDARFWCGKPDVSELPSAYKNADSIRNAINKYRLAKVVDMVIPYGAIMAGDWESDAPWRKTAK